MSQIRGGRGKRSDDVAKIVGRKRKKGGKPVGLKRTEEGGEEKMKVRTALTAQKQPKKNRGWAGPKVFSLQAREVSRIPRPPGLWGKKGKKRGVCPKRKGREAEYSTDQSLGEADQMALSGTQEEEGEEVSCFADGFFPFRIQVKGSSQTFHSAEWWHGWPANLRPARGRRRRRSPVRYAFRE